MKVYCVFRGEYSDGEYSDRTLEAIFSTRRKAKEYIKRNRTINSYVYDSIDDEPIEYDLDEAKIYSFVVFRFYGDKITGRAEFVEKYRDPYEQSGKVYVTVKYNPNIEVMEKAAIDRYNQFQAGAEGLW